MIYGEQPISAEDRKLVDHYIARADGIRLRCGSSASDSRWTVFEMRNANAIDALD